MITLENINRSFGDKQVLHDLSFDIGDSRMTGFVGSNGSGKTTTMRILLGVLAADSGRILVDGTPITAGHRSATGSAARMKSRPLLLGAARFRPAPTSAA